MRFALLGNHPDGVDMAEALVASGRHQWLYSSGTVLPRGSTASTHIRAASSSVYAGETGITSEPRPHGPEGVQQVHDLEEVLADPAVELVIVASGPAHRPAHLRRALQSERHVLCVHPADQTPAVAYEAGMIQQDTRHVLLPLLAEPFHPALIRLKEFLESGSPLGELRLLEVEQCSTEAVLLNAAAVDQKPSVPGWDVLRALGGEVAEVSALAPGEVLEANVPLLLAGRFERGGMFQITLLPYQTEARRLLRVIGSAGQAELLFPLGTPGPAFLSWQEGGERREGFWDVKTPWPVLVEILEEAVAAPRGPRRQVSGENLPPREVRLSWQDEVRCLELDDAARRSVYRRRSSLLEYPEASEEVSFKGTMTLVGCGLLWAIILLAILSRWQPWIGWGVIPLLAVFLMLQLLRWVIPPKEGP